MSLTYDALKAKLPIDLLRLDSDLTELPQLVQEAAEQAADLLNELNSADHELDVAKAQAAADIRAAFEGSKAPSETQISSVIELNPNVQAARVKLNEARFQSKKANDMVSSFRDKSRLIGKCADMIVSGFITPSSVYRKEKEHMAKLRKPTV
jgi:hypothetical protein